MGTMDTCVKFRVMAIFGRIEIIGDMFAASYYIKEILYGYTALLSCLQNIWHIDRTPTARDMPWYPIVG